MRPGMRTGSFPGAVEDAVLDLEAAVPPGSGPALARFRAAAGYGGRWYAVYANGRRAAAAFAPEGAWAGAAVAVDAGAEDLAVQLEDLGGWPGADYDPDFAAREFEAATAQQIRLEWEAVPALSMRGPGAGAFSNWSLAGLKRFSNCAPVEGRGTRGCLRAGLTDAAGVRTVRLYAGAAEVARGTRAGDGTVALGAVNGSGLGGSVDVAYAGDVEPDGAALEARWPAAYRVHYANAALVFPRAAEAEAEDDGASNRFAHASPPLAAGNWHAAVQPVTDTGAAEAGPATQAVTVPGPPEPAAGLAYASGNAAATVIAWQASATAGATYNIYGSALDEPVNLETPLAVHAAGSGTLTQALPAATGYPGVRRVLVRAVAGGSEERNAAVLRIEYDAAGNVAAPRPNSPGIVEIRVAAGRSVTARALCDEFHAAAAAAEARLFLAAEGGAFDWGSPAATAAWSEAVGGVREAELTGVAPADGWYRVAVRAAAAGGTLDAGAAWVTAQVSEAEPAGVAGLEARAARG